MSIVRSRIASFEAQNAGKRTEPPPYSPKHGIEVRVSRNQSDLSRVSGLTGPRSESGLSDHRQRSEAILSALARVDMTDNASTTSTTSHLRRSRLQKEVDRTGESPHMSSPGGSSQEVSSPGGSPGASSSRQSAPASLSERRRARQQRKQMQLSKAKQVHRTEEGTRTTERNSTRPPPQVNDSSKRVPKQSSRRQQPSPESANRRSSSEGLGGHSISKESNRNSMGRLYEQRSRGQLQQNVDQEYVEKLSTPLVFGHPTYSRHSPVDPTDDEATLTSVRQIMDAPVMPKLRKGDMLPEGRRPSVMTRSMSSSSYETEGSRSQYDLHANSSHLLTPPPRDDDTFDYGDRDSDQDDSVIFDQEDSVGFEENRQAAAVYQKKESVEDPNFGSPLLTRADVEHYCRSLDTPVVKTAAGVAVAATVGTLILGPVGLLVGAATVGIGVGVMQIPVEQRNNVRTKATAALQRAHESAMNASEALSSTCAAGFHETNNKLPMEMKQCFQSDERMTKDEVSTIRKSENVVKGDDRSVKGTSVSHEKPNQGQSKNRRVACLRNGRIVPVQQIHGLEPSQQPRAWLDVMASVNTTMEEKNEAMEEIINHSKDKQRARLLLDEGILDSIMYILNCHFDKRGNVTKEELAHAKLAATCCVTLGKAHCAAVHTEGDLLLMSLYERGTVPEERQLAQMLYEVPHHVTRDGKPENFCLQQMNMPKAEDAARAIKALADGRQQTLSQ